MTEIETLQQQAQSLGIEVDGRWSAATLMAKINEAQAAAGAQEAFTAQDVADAPQQPEANVDPAEPEPTGVMWERFGLRPGDPVPFHVCNIMAFERSQDMHQHAAKFGAQVGKQAREGLLEASGTVAPTNTIKRPEQRRVEPSNDDQQS